MIRQASLTAAAAIAMAMGSAAIAQQAGSGQQSGAASGQQQQHQSDSAQTAGAQQSGQQSQQGQMSPDKMFIKMAALHGMKEQKIAEIAQQNAQSEEVKRLAQTIQQDHQQANEKLKQIAQAQGVEIPQQLPQHEQEVVQYFQSLQGQQFDQEFVSAMKAAHAHDISKFQDKSQVAQDQQLKQWVQEQLPKLQQHHQTTVAAASQVGLPAGSGMAGSGASDDAARTAGERQPGVSGSQSGSDFGSSRDASQSGSGAGSSGLGTGTGSPNSAGGTGTGAGQSGGASQSGSSGSGSGSQSR